MTDNRHPSANVDECWETLCGLFVGSPKLTPQEQRLWRDEFGGRPAAVCINSIRELKLRNADQFLPIASFVSHCNGGSKGAAAVYARTRTYMADMNAKRPEAEASRVKITEWCREARQANPEHFATFHAAAVKDFGNISESLRRKWYDSDPCESVTLAAVVKAFYDKQRSRHDHGLGLDEDMRRALV